jgi:uncharacterized protein with PIN domain
MLRILFGVPAVYSAELKDAELAETECFVVTRDKDLFRRRRGSTLLIATDDHVKWVAAFLKLGLKPFTKSACPVCGGALAEVSCKEAERAVGHEIHSNRCWRCVFCGRFYWVGSHWRGLRRLVEEAEKTMVDCLNIG